MTDGYSCVNHFAYCCLNSEQKRNYLDPNPWKAENLLHWGYPQFTPAEPHGSQGPAKNFLKTHWCKPMSTTKLTAWHEHKFGHFWGHKLELHKEQWNYPQQTDSICNSSWKAAAHVHSESNAKAESTDSSCSWEIFSKMSSNKTNPSRLSEQNSETGLEEEVHTFFIQKNPLNKPWDIRIHEQKNPNGRIFSRTHISAPDWGLFSWWPLASSYRSSTLLCLLFSY